MAVNSVQVKNEGRIVAEARKGVGYTIRHKDYVGATFTITEDLKLRIGQSYSVKYSMEDWRLINEEIKAGEVYMLKVKTYGGYPFEFNNVPKPEKIMPKNYEECCLYEDGKGRGILYLGRATIVKNEYGFDQNREKSPYVCGFFNNVQNIVGVQTDGNIMNIQFSDTKYGAFDFDSRVGKPANLVRLVYQGNGTETIFNVNGKFALQIVRGGRVRVLR